MFLSFDSDYTGILLSLTSISLNSTLTEVIHDSINNGKMTAKHMKKLTVRCSDEEHQILVDYCNKKERKQNDVLRELIRNLQAK